MTILDIENKVIYVGFDFEGDKEGSSGHFSTTI
jgi:hypothetical protein